MNTSALPTERAARFVSGARAEPSTRSSSSSAQLAFTSYLRVVAIIGIVLIHTAGLTYINDDLRHTGVWWVASLATFSTKWAVPTFVMVSGTLLLEPPSDLSPTRFYRRRLARIGIPLVVWHVVYIMLSATILVTTVEPRILLARFLRGQSYTGLYFFWLILGLYLITPLLWPLVAGASRRTLGAVGSLLVAATALNQSTLQVIGQLEGGGSPGGDPTLLTQCIPYVGFFLLGYALRDFVVTGRGRVLALGAVTLGLCLELTWQATGGASVFGVQTAKILNVLSPVHYQGWVLGSASVAVFVLFRSVVHPKSRWATPRAARLARSTGDLTLGVFATHLLVLIVLMRIPGRHLSSGATTLTQLAALCTATLLGSLALTIVLRRIPLLRPSV